MTKKELKKWLPEITHWVNGGELYAYDPIDDTWNIKTAKIFRTDQIYVIKDKCFEARKAFASGEDVEVYSDATGFWVNCDKPLWNLNSEYRPKPKKPKEVYEWQWISKKSKGEYGMTSAFYSIVAEELGWVKFEPSKRLKK